MATTITFVKGGTTVTLPGPAPGGVTRQRKAQNVSRSAAGDVYVYDKGVDRYEADLSFESLSDSEKADLLSFFDTTVDGAVETFTYTDTNGAAYAARITEPDLEFRKVAGGVWDVTLRLELSAIHG